jgi:hypothetical protein
VKPFKCTASALIIRSRPRIASETDTGLRLIRGQVALGYGESFDEEWVWLVGPAGEGWCSVSWLEPTDPAIVNAWPRRPHGLTEIRQVFGTEGNPQCSSGKVTLPAPIGTTRWFACHKLVAEVMQSAFDEIHRKDLWHLLKTWDGCYNKRKKTGTSTKWSTHSWGIAVDLNAATNGFGRVPTMDQRIVAIFKDHGFIWGGDWSRPDGMHFQYASGY